MSLQENIEEFLSTLPFSVKSTYGGNKTSIEVVTDDNDIIIRDCGSGMVNLGKHMLQPILQGEGHSLHTDDAYSLIISRAFLLWPFYFEGNRFIFYSPPRILRRLDNQHAATHFPISLDYKPSTKEFFQVGEEEEFFLNDIRIFTKRMPHPGTSYGYRIEHNGKVFVYSSDCEFNIEKIDDIQDYMIFS
jgi:phosphoribosyl 1,2-cyclic phosphodiesterase